MPTQQNSEDTPTSPGTTGGGTTGGGTTGGGTTGGFGPLPLIPRGTSDQARFDSSDTGSTSPYVEWSVLFGGISGETKGSFSSANPTPESVTQLKHGWEVTSGGFVSVPTSLADAPSGVYSVTFKSDAVSSTGPQGQPLHETRTYSFEVVCMTVDIGVPSGESSGGQLIGYIFNPTTKGGTAPITFSYSPTPTNGAFPPQAQPYEVTVTATDANGCTATSTGTVPAGGGGTGGGSGGGTPCTLTATLLTTELGGGHYSAEAVDVSGATGTPVLALMRNGAALANVSGHPLRVLFDCAVGETVTLAGTLTDSACAIPLREKFTNSDAGAGTGGGTGGTGGSGGSGGGSGGGGGGTGSGTDCAVPAVPAAPTLARDCAAGTLTLTCPAFMANVTRIEIERENLAGIFHTFTAAGTYADPAPGLESHRYRARACNAVGCSEWSDWSAALGLASPVVPVWTAPAPATPPPVISGVVSLAGTAGERAALAASSPVSIRVFGGELPVSYDAGTNTYHASFDSAMAYQGTLGVVLQARDLAGCLSLPVTLGLTLDNSLERGARWSELGLDPAVEAEMLARGEVVLHTGYYAKLLQGGAPDMQRYFRWYVVSPDPGAATPAILLDNTAMRARVKSWQDAPLNDTLRLITPAVAGATAPDHTARLAMESVACEAMGLYNPLAEHVLKFRQTKEDEVEILTSEAWLTFTKDGLVTRAVFADYSITGTVVDGARVGDKIYLARQGSKRILVIDTSLDSTFGPTAAQAVGALAPWVETRFCKWIENRGGQPIFIYSDSDSATGYILKPGGAFDDCFTLDRAVTGAWVREGDLVLALGATGDLEPELATVSSDGALTTLVFTPETASAFQKFSASQSASGASETEYGDVEGSAFAVDASQAALIASNLSGGIADLGRFRGAAPAPRGVLVLRGGPNASKVFLKNGAFYEPRWELQDLEGNAATRVIALARLYLTLRAASGDPLKGGDPGLFSESLLVAFETVAGAFLARIQVADVDASRVKRGRVVTRENFKRARATPAP